MKTPLKLETQKAQMTIDALVTRASEVLNQMGHSFTVADRNINNCAGKSIVMAGAWVSINIAYRGPNCFDRHATGGVRLSYDLPNLNRSYGYSRKNVLAKIGTTGDDVVKLLLGLVEAKQEQAR
jgi:hypothetical protein